MVRVDSARCTGCGNCVDICPQQAITIHDNLAMINETLCIQCGTCAEVCSAGAIHELAPAHAKLSKGGERMTYGYGRGFGFRGASPPWPYVGRGRGGLPRCWYPGLWGAPVAAAPYTTPWAATYGPAPTREEELGLLRGQSDIIKRQLEDIESQIQELKKKE